MIPTLHLNGTSFETLLNEATKAHAALTHAISALQDMTVHARDYYVQSDSAYSTARAEHEKRVETLRRVQHELLDYTLALMMQKEARV